MVGNEDSNRNEVVLNLVGHGTWALYGVRWEPLEGSERRTDMISLVLQKGIPPVAMLKIYPQYVKTETRGINMDS
jgi:hypothetical protein